MRAYEIVANDLDDRNMQKLADRVTDVMSRIAQSTATQDTEPATQDTEPVTVQGTYDMSPAAKAYWKPYNDQLHAFDADQKAKQQVEDARLEVARSWASGQATPASGATNQSAAGNTQAPAGGTQSAAGMTNSEQVLANQYLNWGQAQPNKSGLLNTIYQHALQNQSPQYVNKLMTFLKANGITQ